MAVDAVARAMAKRASGGAGSPGADGKSAYEVALDNGFVGTEPQWLASLVGPAGTDGTDGADGAEGPQGDPGIQGPPGSDGWTYIRLAADFSTNSASAVDAGLGFTPAAGLRYEFEAHLLCRTATATVGPRPGVAWPTGMSDGVASIYVPSSVSAEVQQHGNINAAILAPVGGLPNATQSYGAKIVGTAIAGASPAGQVKVQLASETAGTNVTLKAGSWLKYRLVT